MHLVQDDGIKQYIWTKLYITNGLIGGGRHSIPIMYIGQFK